MVASWSPDPTTAGQSARTLDTVLELKYGPVSRRGWGPSLRARFNYATPDDIYETLVFDLVSSETYWLDVGCGRDIFPSNRPTAKLLSDRCKLLVGLDPDPNIEENHFVHRRAKMLLEEYRTELQFDLITFRMVAEHVRNPEGVIESLQRLTKIGGRVIIYTISRWAPVSILAYWTPTSLHRAVKRVLWRSEDRDTFPVVYKMNTKRDLARLFCSAGFEIISFEYLDDCRTLQRWRSLNLMELWLRRFLRKFGIAYPEACILAVFERHRESTLEN